MRFPKVIALVIALLSWLLSSGVATASSEEGNITISEDNNGCASTSQELNAQLMAPRDDVTEIQILTICPNSVIAYEDGNPLLISTPNTHIRCGPFGNLRDNCTLVNRIPGTNIPAVTLRVFQILDISATGRLDNIIVSGVTFEGLATSSVAATLGFQGFVAFLNCEFRNYVLLREGLLVLIGSQGSDVLLDDCIFRNNTLVANHEGGAAIVFMTSPQQRVTFNRTQFIGNNFASLTDSTKATSIFRVNLDKEATVDVKNCCFINNAFNGPLFAVEVTTEWTFTDNFVDSLACSGCTLLEVGNGTCIEGDADVCSAELLPSDVPTEALQEACAPKSSACYSSASLLFLFVVLNWFV